MLKWYVRYNLLQVTLIEEGGAFYVCLMFLKTGEYFLENDKYKEFSRRLYL